ncbi:hypothetical protein HDU82_000672, partial [Entophlyctis luteolus]
AEMDEKFDSDSYSPDDACELDFNELPRAVENSSLISELMAIPPPPPPPPPPPAPVLCGDVYVAPGFELKVAEELRHSKSKKRDRHRHSRDGDDGEERKSRRRKKHRHHRHEEGDDERDERDSRDSTRRSHDGDVDGERADAAAVPVDADLGDGAGPDVGVVEG